MKRYVVWKEYGNYKVTSEDNYNSVYRNEREVNTLTGFDNANQVICYLQSLSINNEFIEIDN